MSEWKYMTRFPDGRPVRFKGDYCEIKYFGIWWPHIGHLLGGAL